MKRLLAGLLLATTVWAGTPDPIKPVPTPGASFYSTLKTWLNNEIYNERQEIGVGAYFVVCGCLDVVGPGLTHTPSNCIAYTAGYRVTESQSIVYPDGSTCQVVVEQGTVGNITAPDTTLWTRVPNSHYMLNCTGGSSAPVTAIKVFTVTTAAGAVTAITDTRPLYPVDTADITDGAITRPKLADELATVVGLDPSPQSTEWTGPVSVGGSETPLKSLNVTTHGRPLLVLLTVSAQLTAVVLDSITYTIKIKVDGTTYNMGVIVNDSASTVTTRTVTLFALVVPSAGVHTILVTGRCGGSGGSCDNSAGRIAALELL